KCQPGRTRVPTGRLGVCNPRSSPAPVFRFTCPASACQLARLSACTPYGLLLGVARLYQYQIVLRPLSTRFGMSFWISALKSKRTGPQSASVVGSDEQSFGADEQAQGLEPSPQTTAKATIADNAAILAER